jgi:hypothetical protein
MENKAINIYQYVNKEILDLFIDKSQGLEYLIMAFDDNDIINISKKFDFIPEDFKLNILDNGANSKWDRFLTIIDNIPQCFGMIALEILCASRMERTNSYTENAYNLIFKEYINQNNIQTNYSKYQDKIWGLAKSYIEQDLNFKTTIPEPKIGKGRFVQYPLSQVYLNKNDLFNFRGAFQFKDLKPSQAIRFEDLNLILEINQGFNTIDKEYKTSHFNIVINRNTFQLLIVQQQIHNEFLNWTGELVINSEKERKPIKKLHCEHYGKTSFNFYYYCQQETYDVKKSNFKSELIQNNIISKSTDYIVLRVPEGKYDFEDVRKVKIDEEVIILVFNLDCPIVNDLANINILPIDIGLRESVIYNFIMNNAIAESNLGKKIISLCRNNLLELKNGYRLLNNIFLKNHGPNYLIKEDLRIKINQETKCLKSGENLDLSCLDIGEYSISISKAHNFTIQICENYISNTIDKSGKGWNIVEYKPFQDNFDICGLHIENSYVINSTKSFIDVVIKRKKIQTENQILKTLSRLN